MIGYIVCLVLVAPLQIGWKMDPWRDSVDWMRRSVAGVGRVNKSSKEWSGIAEIGQMMVKEGVEETEEQSDIVELTSKVRGQVVCVLG
jgi:hypothetical protein